MQYQELVNYIAYESIVESYEQQGISEAEVVAILEKSGSGRKLLNSIINTGKVIHKIYKVTAGSKDNAIEKYRNQKRAYENETDPKEKERLYKRMKNTASDHGVDDNSRKGYEHVTDAISNGAKALINKAKGANKSEPIGLAGLRKEQEK